MEVARTELSVNTLSTRAKVGLIALCLACTSVMFGMLGMRYAGWILDFGFRWYLLLVVASSLVVIVLHELLHALFFKIFGGSVSFGAKWTKLGPAFYATSPDDYGRMRYQIVGLAPQILTVALLLLSLVVPSTMLSMAFIVMAIMNLAGGCFDIYTVIWLRKFPRGCLVQDTKDGLKVLVESTKNVRFTSSP